ncbi:MAG: aminoacyl-tRNA hydrolase [Clostridiales Family XIII bacterium]|jgi:PTH1 family peptidyl-tRNA hydrolase|nr:aminoacyl-tRNA hydrolase [Clostridiales Family XIII bacterium]
MGIFRKETDITILVGLGNPGQKYEKTRHNAGWRVIDALAAAHGISVSKEKHKGLTGEGRIGRRKVLLVKPMTFMNDSGACVGSLLRYYRIDLSRLVLIYDDIDLATGTIRIRKSGGAGTHNGMRSVLAHIHEEGFPRIRLGVGSGRGERELVDFVLGRFTAEEKKPFEEAVERAALAAAMIVTDGVDLAMNRYNG